MSETKSTKPKLVDIIVLKPGVEASFVQYYDKTRGPIRVTIPNIVIEEGKVSLEDLEMGAASPTDIDWERISVKTISSSTLAKAMRDHGIFTKEDFAAKRQEALIIINRLTGLLLQDIAEQI